MKRYFNIAKQLLFSVLILSGCAACLSGCGGDDEPPGDQIRDRLGGNYIVNLFPDSHFGANSGETKLSFQQAFDQSSLVIHAAYVKKIDSSCQPDVHFYLYEAPRGVVQKPLRNQRQHKKSKHPRNISKDTVLVFLSREELFRGQAISDSVYLFLEPLQGYDVLRRNMGVKYGWVRAAPFLTP